MRINHGIEIEGGGGSEVLGGEYLKGVIVGGGEEREGVKGVKGEMSDAELVGGGGFVGFGCWVIGVVLQSIFGALEVPEVYRGGGAA